LGLRSVVVNALRIGKASKGHHNMNIFNDVRIVLAEPKASLRRQYMEVLQNLGCRAILETGNLKDVHDAFVNGEVDVLIGDNTLPEGRLGDLIRDIRHGRIGDNPFIIATVLVGENAPDILKTVVDSGADDILVRPFEAERIGERLRSFASGRKLFAVTSDYIGPDRRGGKRGEGVQIPLIKVPNPFQLRVSGANGAAARRRAIDLAKKQVNEQKIERQAHFVQWLMKSILAVHNGEQPGESIDMKAPIGHLNEIATDITQRLESTSYHHAMEVCMTLEKMTGVLRESSELFDEEEVDLMFKLVEVIHRKCNGNDPMTERSCPVGGRLPEMAAV